MPARNVVLLTSSESFHPTQLPSRQRSTPLNPLAATLMDPPASVANKRLTADLSPLDATLTKNRGVGGVMVNQLPLSSNISTRLQPSFVLNRFHTLSFSVSCNSCICHSYENCRVRTNNSQSETLRCKLTRRPSADSTLIPFLSLDFQLSTVNFQPPDPLSPFLAALPSPPGRQTRYSREGLAESASHFTVQWEIWLCV